MKITITISTNGAAFDDDPGGEVARILRKYADECDGTEPEDGTLRDINGNTVGKVDIFDN